MILSRKAKEAIKVALALVLVYWVAMSQGWMNPYWAAFAVAMIALPTAGQSISKGLLRLLGTISGCIAALVILSLAPQNRWLFIFLACVWIFFTTYMMLADKQRSYLWNVAGFVCLIIILSAPGGDDNIFQHAIFRTVETALGVVVYTLVTVFIWPYTNSGAIRKASAELLGTQFQLFQAGQNLMLGQDTKAQLPELRAQQSQQLGQLSQALQAEGSESYEVKEQRDSLEHFQALSTALMASLDRWLISITEVAHIDINESLPDLQCFYNELSRRFDGIQKMINNKTPGDQPQPVALNIERSAIDRLPVLDRAALAVIRKELETLSGLSYSLFNCVQELGDYSADSRKATLIMPFNAEKQGLKTLPIPDWDHGHGAIFAALSVFAGFFIWIYFNPPGHAGWFQMAGSLSMALAGMQQFKIIILLKPFAVALLLGLGVYVFILPQLSMFAELALLLFACMFLVCYFFSGFARLAGMIAIINMISVQNQQTYNFAAMANSYIYILLTFLFIYVMSYMLHSARPEKAVLKLVRRFFNSLDFLFKQRVKGPGHRSSFIERWKQAFYLHEMQTLPDKLAVWGKSIDHKLFPNNTPEQIQELVTSLQILVYRVEQLQNIGQIDQKDCATNELYDEILIWQTAIKKTFAHWSDQPGAQLENDHRQVIKVWLNAMETRVDATVDKFKGHVGEIEGERFYRLLGSYRGVTEAALAYARVAGSIDWNQWQEEKFS